MKTILLMAAAAAALVSATSANAATYLVNLNTSYGSGSATLTTATNNAGFNLVSSLIGTFDGGEITLLAPGAYPSVAPNDNLFSAASPYFTFSGLSFKANGLSYNLYSNGGIKICGETSACSNGTINSFSVQLAAVPEPASWAMMIGGLGLAGAAMRRRSTKISFA